MEFEGLVKAAFDEVVSMVIREVVRETVERFKRAVLSVRDGGYKGGELAFVLGYASGIREVVKGWVDHADEEVKREFIGYSRLLDSLRRRSEEELGLGVVGVGQGG